ncbi:MAG TPA: alpha/beta hydrolase [Xanthobacteraceae bacterium]|nr:alpha/beta hydrolase [Xanthobacteraceae bacterium]
MQEPGVSRHKGNFRMEIIRRFVAACLAALPWTAARHAGAAESPLVIAKSGYLFAGGKIDTSLPGSPMVGQLYAEFQIPQKLLHPYPIVMIHGGSQTGTNFTGTPDGREGWAQYFLRRGYAVYVVDQVARGRAGYWAQNFGPVTAPDLDRTLQRFAAPERYNLWPQAHLHTQWPGAAKPGDPSFDAFYATQFPSLTDFAEQQALNRDAGAALLDKIGPAILLTHSQSGAMGWPIADLRPNLVKAIVAVEPSGPPVHDIEFKGAPDWFSDAAKTKISGLGDVPLTYDPPLQADEQLSFVRQDKANKPDLVRCWSQAEPARKLKNLIGIPILIISSEASYHASYDHCTAAYLTRAGVTNTFVHLADHGIHGNGHMMMLEKNSDAIAGVIEGWLRALPANATQR